MEIVSFVKKYITNCRNAFAFELKCDPRYWSLSAITYHYHKDIVKVINGKQFGKLLDAGAGGLNGKVLFNGHVSSYTSLDVVNRTGEVDIVGDIQNMTDVENNAFDTVYSSQVLEHIPHPAKVLSEFQRVLKINGTCIISVPHISHYHEVPNDYFRFTEFGISNMLRDAGFVIQRIERQSGIVSLLTHPLSILIISIFWRIPILKWLGFYFNKLVVVLPSYYLDKILPLTKLYPLNILVLATLAKKV